MKSAERTQFILIVDDEEIWRGVIEDLLEGKISYDFLEADSFEKAQTILEESSTDIVLAIIDMRLVDESRFNVQGMQVLKKAKELNPAMKTVIFTGYPDVEEERRVREYYKADEYLEKAPDGKPLDIEAFQETILNLLGS